MPVPPPGLRTSTSAVIARRAAACVLGVAVVGLGGCASDEAGFGLPTLSARDAEDLFGESVHDASGRLHVESNGCFTWLDDDADDDDDVTTVAVAPWVVWPSGFAQDDDAVLLPGGGRASEGTAMEVSGVVVSLDQLPDGANPDSYFGAFGGFCGAGERGVLVLTQADLR